MDFPASLDQILQRLDEVNPRAYGSTRNYTDGAVTYLSPYISRGVISTRQVLLHLVSKNYTLGHMEVLVKELAWRDYFQRVGQLKNLDEDLKQRQHPVENYGLPRAIAEGKTGINGIDEAIQDFLRTGYMHNHCRMYVASLACNMGRSHWKNPAQWMYYHLLDGDWASNVCSWHWVAGSNSSKKYYANQENISKFTHSPQKNTYLDKPVEYLQSAAIPEILKEVTHFEGKTELPTPSNIHLDPTKPTLLYNYYNLDPKWHAGTTANRILLLEPSFFQKYPISKHCLQFALALGNNIPDLQLFVGEFDALLQLYKPGKIIFKEHPFNTHYRGQEESRAWISDKLTTYYPSFFAYWKELHKELLKENSRMAG
ncbi:MAG: deoxyribodipyrimidine photolyase [Saprospiraceae bacterium]|nr:deoxyribodipyrimidine photolyase [Saprospiraceae bacterium]